MPSSPTPQTLLVALACAVVMSACSSTTRSEAENATRSTAGSTATHSVPYDTVTVDPPYPPHVDDGTGIRPPRVLCVTAHPDDEIAFGATLFKIATHLGGHCELAILTNGEGGYKYSTLAELLYGVELTDERVGRGELPRIRRAEQIEAAKVLGLQRVHFFNQTDHRYTRDASEVLGDDAEVWDLPSVRAGLRELLDEGSFDFVFVHLPTERTHGHHKAATILALEAAHSLPRERRPVALGAFGRDSEKAPPRYPNRLLDYPITLFSKEHVWVFDRSVKFGYRDRLDYGIVVRWAVTSHRSQGTYQAFVGGWDLECYYAFELDVPDRVSRADDLFERLAEPQFSTPVYDEHGHRTDVLAPGVKPPEEPQPEATPTESESSPESAADDADTAGTGN